ncbi:peroxiredoxin [Tsukamurella paurometabola]|uniref:Alkyl hydroperoxide reductase E n=1 Tax=Tsukamurella paurometabola (strain ATCC 8368 / DSM 20162 / CCUG 35730 / CIP 100753 / JCM 10117 / KCTC 9821 / NBRC 16120 / NCIMB 702349 / NCTC 13040) TaxID=521096 RepID=D5USP7_TSUPD|nr:peroxiredoxin [Tsukamurella paurometabola]ADG79318.1 alkyl hydroperoxide reductase/ Thiol specific antioxidant/ Mal allergen [Tsukamurella paurometabola DSM 20162]
MTDLPEGPLPVGSIAPDFTLRDQNNRPVSLSSYRGEKNVLLVFFPLAFTGTCESELGGIRDSLQLFENDDAAVIAISVGPPPTHKVWSGSQGYLFPVVSDFWPHGAVSRAYGVLNEKNGYPNRGTFVVDRDGVIRFAEMNEPGVPRDQSLWEHALAALASTGRRV